MAPDMTSPTPVRRSARSWRELIIEANGGIIATAGIVEGMVAADVRTQTVLISSVVALVVGSVSTAGAAFTEAAFQRDAAQEAIEHQRDLLRQDPQTELDELVEVYEEKGLSPALARAVAQELTEHDALAAHVEEELDVVEDDFDQPAAVALSAGLAFAAGALMPILIGFLVPYNVRILTTAIAVTLALIVTSIIGARVGHTRTVPTVVRAVAIGLVTLLLAMLVGEWIG